VTDAVDRRQFLSRSLCAAAALRAAPSLAEWPLAASPTAFLYDDIYLEHDAGERHPESPERLRAIDRHVRQAEWYSRLLQLKSKPVDVDTLALVHDREYIAKVKSEVESGAKKLSTGDTNISAASYRVALAAVGGVLGALDTVMTGKAKNAFCAVRPPGHHTGPSRGMGFCVFNNVAVAARYAQKKYGLDRVLIADWDVHHGNGTQDTFYRDGSVMYVSTHQSPFYPRTGAREETGEGKGAGLTVNRPVAEGTSSEEIVAYWRNDFFPAAKKFKPDLVLLSTGFDSRIDDRLGRLKITDDGYREMTKLMLEVASASAKHRLVAVLEGGYNVEGLASGVVAHMDELVKA
jgi:acetoin utilization deacetylase AcuC-like enzyme